MPLIVVSIKIRAFLWGLFWAFFWMVVTSLVFDLGWWMAWFAGVNIATFIYMGWDKSAAKSNRRRTPEAALLGLAFVGGFPGLFAGRKTFRHKTTKTSFVSSMWLLFFLQLGMVAYFVGNITNLDSLLTALGAEKKTISTPK